VTLSWIYILYTVNGNYYITAFNNTTNATSCGGGGSNPKGAFCTPCASGASLTLNQFSGALSASFTTSGGCGGSPRTDYTFTNSSTSPTCGSNIVFNGGQITSTGGATILAAVAFGAGTQRAICPNNSSPGNSVCGIEL
jgi:hypothetical protein